MCYFLKIHPVYIHLTLFVVLCFVSKVLEGRSYKLQHPWVGIVNRSQADINKNVDMIVARRKEREYFANSPDYSHLASKMGSEYLAKLLSRVYNILSPLEFMKIPLYESLIICF